MQHTIEAAKHQYIVLMDGPEPEPDDAPELADRWEQKLPAFKRAPSMSLTEAARRGYRWAVRRVSRPLPVGAGRRTRRRRDSSGATTPAVTMTDRHHISGASRLQRPTTAEFVDALLDELATKLIHQLLAMVEKRHDIAQRLREVLVAGTTAGTIQKFMSVDEYSRHARVSSRTIRGYISRDMVEGEHFHREGRTGRRVIVHVEAADAWRASRRFAKNKERSLDDLATNDVLRRRAHVALKKAGFRR